MPSPTATVEAAQRLLADTGLPDRELLEPEQYEDAIQWAVAGYSRDRPLVAHEDVAGAGSEYIALHDLARWTQDFSTVLSVEYPAGDVVPGYEPNIIAPDWYNLYRPADDEVYLRLLIAQPTALEKVRITFTAHHVHELGEDLETTVSTIPDAHFRAFMALVASRCCLILAARKAGDTEGRQGIDDMNYGDGRSRYEAMATAFRKSYEQILGIGVQADETPTLASGRRRWQSIPALERAATRLIRGVS